MLNKLRVLCIFIIVLLGMSLLSGCQSSSEGINEKMLHSERLKIGVFIYRYDDQFIQSMMSEMEKVEKSFEDDGLQVDFYNGKNQQSIQSEQIEKAIEENYDVLVVNLVDRSMASEVIEKAQKKDIPIVFFNREPVEVDMARAENLYYIGAEGIEAGKLQGEMVADYIAHHPEVDKNNDGIIQYVMLQGQPGHQDAIFRSEYAVKAAKEKGLALEEITKESANWQRSEANNIMDKWLMSFGNEIELIFSNNDAMALGAIDAMNTIGYKDNYIPIVGVDAIEEAKEAVVNEQMIGTVINDFESQGLMIMKVAYLLSQDKDPNEEIENLIQGTYYYVPYIKYYNESQLNE